MNKLILFDIDGTLMNVNSTYMREMIAELFREMNLADKHHRDIPFAGRTDRAIFSDLLGNHDHDGSYFNRVKNAYLARLQTRIQPHWIHVPDGVVETVSWCISMQIPFGLLTGNFEEAAYTKLRCGGLADYFAFGAFGCEHTDRNQLPSVAHKIAEERYQRSFAAEDVIIIGDTPNDIACAKYFGAQSVAVTTGPFDAETLSRYEPDVLLTNMTDPDAWLPDLLESCM